MNLLDFLFPRRCVGCGKIGNYFCKQCRSKIESITHPVCPVCGGPAIDGATHPRCQTRYSLDGLTSFFRYDGAIRKAVKAIKYRFVSDLAKEFISLIPNSRLSGIHDAVFVHPSQTASGQLSINNYQSAILIPIPLHPSRLRFRGFNQAEVLGRLLAKRLNIPMKIGVLKRIRKTIPQVEMKDRKKRLKNMEDVFAAFPNILISQYLNILLFDDVFTTGATLRAAANVLKRAGAKKVWGVVMAHG
ncbi:ComF family protein [Candidatus Gottesmanbacteria bacterium]|nr:ComF family protein [Candidatus Gottesmanbacteria bacterium]